MPMVPEAIVAMLACARLGVMHSVVFAGFSATRAAGPHRGREAKMVITTDGQFRRGQAVSLKTGVDEAIDGLGADSPVEHVVVVRRTGIDVAVDRGPRPVVGRDRPEGLHRAHPRGVRRRAPAVPALHLGHHRQAQGHRAHLGRLPDPGVLHPLQRLRPQSRTPTCTGAPPTSAGSPATPTSSTGRCPTASPRWSTRAPRPRPTSTATSRSSKSTVSQSITPRRRWSARS